MGAGPQTGEGGGHHRAGASWRPWRADLSLWAFDISQAAPEEKKTNPFPAVSLLPKISSVGSKGDFLLVSKHVIELLTKMYRAVLDATQRQLPVTVTEE